MNQVIHPAAEAPMAGDPGERGKLMYDMNETPVLAYAKDPRFSYCLYMPPEMLERDDPPELLVMVHGTARTFMKYRDALAEFGRWNYCAVLCPLFPAGVLGDGNRDGFKQLREGDIRYDKVLLGMVKEVGAKYGTTFNRFALAGYSGGGQFVNRFMYLHPERLWASSVGAPGSVTLLDTDRNWWVGVADMQKIFGIGLDLEALRRVPVQLVVGSSDRETWEITHREGGRHWMPGANDAGRTRPERLATLQRTLEAAGVQARLDIVPDVAHDGINCLGVMKTFLAASLKQLRADQAGPGPELAPAPISVST